MAGYHVDSQMDYLRDSYSTATGKFDLYYLFVELALKPYRKF